MDECRKRMTPAMLTNIKQAFALMLLIIALSVSLPAQSSGNAQTERVPTTPTRPFVVLPAQSLSDLERRLQPGNKVEELIGGQGMQLRVAVQHDKSRPTADAE